MRQKDHNRNDRKEIIGAVVLNQDITEQVKAEELIRNANVSLMNAILGFSSLLEKERNFQAGYGHYLGKPFKKDMLV